jgi:hypothetical protein
MPKKKMAEQLAWQAAYFCETHHHFLVQTRHRFGRKPTSSFGAGEQASTLP